MVDAQSNPGRILCVGLVCLDVVHVIKGFPEEDSDQRSIDQYSSRGGNASNSATVLAMLGEQCEYFGTLAEGSLELPSIARNFDASSIVYRNCIRIPECICPNSAILVNRETASRTIIHTNLNLPELTLDNFKTLDLDQYTWLHFEGRNLMNVKKMMNYAKTVRPQLPISVEVEKVGRNFEELIPLADVVLMSKEMAQSHGASQKEDAAPLFKTKLRPGAKLICAWGEAGGVALDSTGHVYSSPAYPPAKGVVDTIGAGDTFNGAIIASLHHGKPLDRALIVGCKVAGAKVGMRGFQGLRDIFEHVEDH